MLSSLIQRFGRRAVFPAPMPDTPTCVIGDVHGCIRQLQNLLPKIPRDHRVILVGDYVDRGENSADVLRLIQNRPDFICLKGNHEDMMLNFLRDPEEYGPRWLRYGGLQTLASFGVRNVRAEMTAAELVACRDNLLVEMGPELVRWITELRAFDYSGNVLVAHAGANPNTSPDQQSEKNLMWGHPEFRTTDRRDGVWVVYGHTIVDQAAARRGRIAVDTGAFATGVLSAVCLDGGEPTFISARP
ncbi:metallophosphoesterase family protein [Ruegeria sp. A3M17]|uniref:metallophosphoesterase family protein n=1 Tax=Ruegeria sp. A3M17 TaxID=2267229 RepID=UPI001F45ECDF|nr:metallophosphoesterase family protein [Ruegeria sp. A3M17]